MFIFLTPPDLAELRSRITGRGTDSAEVIDERMRVAREEIEMMALYDYAVVNDEVPKAVQRIRESISVNIFALTSDRNLYQNVRGAVRNMMLKPSIDSLLDRVNSKYSLVILASKRAHELDAGAQATLENFDSVKAWVKHLKKSKRN